MDTQVTRITRFESDLIKQLFDKAGEPCPEPNPGFFEDEKNIMLVSHTDGPVSGFLWAYILLRPDKGSSKMFLYSIDVFEPFRCQGIATFLIQHLKEIALANNCYRMFVPTSKNNLAAVTLYKRTGGVAQNDDAVTFNYDEEALNT